MSYILLICYFFSLYFFGYFILRFFSFTLSSCLGQIYRIVIGIIIGIPVTYLLSCLFRYTQEPIVYGSIAFIGIGAVLMALNRKIRVKKYSVSTSTYCYLEIFLFVLAVLVGYWIMWKSMHFGVNGEWLVARNTVFDTAHALSLIRSFSWGANIPYLSPFAAGFPDMYHFMFYFFVAVVEKLGIPLLYAFNILGALGFALYLMGGYYFAYFIAGKNQIVGITTMIFLLTNSTLTWVFVLLREGLKPSLIEKLWHLPNYIFAGPYDGSTISLFFTLNVFVNQRHLSFAIAGGLFLTLIAHQLFKNQKVSKWISAVMGAIVASLFLWNFIITLTTMCLIIFMGIVERKHRQLLSMLCGFIFVGAISLWPFGSTLRDVLTESVKGDANMNVRLSLVSFLRNQAAYWVMNLGFGLIASVVGWKYLRNEQKKVFIPFLFLFFAIAIGSMFGRNEITQKVINFWNVGFVSLCAYGVVKLWNGGLSRRVVAILLFLTMIVSGLIDIMVIKNDFAYPAVTRSMDDRINKIHSATPSDAVILSYKEMFHEVALSGRKQYYGLFASPNASNRQKDEKSIFEARTKEELLNEINKTKITYLYVSKMLKTDFIYIFDLDLYRRTFKNIYEDDEYILFEVISPMVQ